MPVAWLCGQKRAGARAKATYDVAMKHLILPATALCLLSACSAATEVPTPTDTALSSEPSIYDTIAPPISEYMATPSALIFSKTREWRHEEGIAGANLYFMNLAKSRGMGTFSTENGAVFNAEDMARFDLVVMNNMTGDSLSPAQETVFQNWVEAGGAVLAVHGSGDSSHSDWPWYADTVIGPTFISHPMDPQIQEAKVETLAPKHPVMAGMPDYFMHPDEWYTFDSVPGEGFVVLAGLDESTYSPVNNVYGVSDLRMGEGAENHPIIWARCIGKGRVVYSALGHLDTAYDTPEYQKLLGNALDWVRGETDAEGAGCSN